MIKYSIKNNLNSNGGKNKRLLIYFISAVLIFLLGMYFQNIISSPSVKTDNQPFHPKVTEAQRSISGTIVNINETGFTTKDNSNKQTQYKFAESYKLVNTTGKVIPLNEIKPGAKVIVNFTSDEDGNRFANTIRLLK